MSLQEELENITNEMRDGTDTFVDNTLNEFDWNPQFPKMTEALKKIDSKIQESVDNLAQAEDDKNNEKIEEIKERLSKLKAKEKEVYKLYRKESEKNSTKI